jgi:hypothetical protein
MGKTIDEWIDELQANIKTAEQDVIGDMGEDAWEGGASDVIRSVVDMSDAPTEAKAEVLRMEGIPWAKPGTDTDQDDWLL